MKIEDALAVEKIVKEAGWTIESVITEISFNPSCIFDVLVGFKGHATGLVTSETVVRVVVGDRRWTCLGDAEPECRKLFGLLRSTRVFGHSYVCTSIGDPEVVTHTRMPISEHRPNGVGAAPKWLEVAVGFNLVEMVLSPSPKDPG